MYYTLSCVITGCTWMESTWTRWRYILQSSIRSQPARQCCRRLFAGITPSAGMCRLSISTLLSWPTGRVPAAPAAPLKSMSRRQIPKMHISPGMWLTAVSCSRPLVTLCWPGDSLPEWTATVINRRLFLSTTFRYTEPLSFRHPVILYAAIMALMCLSISPHWTLSLHCTKWEKCECVWFNVPLDT